MIKNTGLRHLALRVSNVERAADFYRRVFGMRIVWQPDPDNAYLTSGCDNLALHRGEVAGATAHALDHLGFIVATTDDLEAGYRWAIENGLDIVNPLRRHRDGSMSFYIRDPDGNVIQALFEPGISPIVFDTPVKS